MICLRASEVDGSVGKGACRKPGDLPPSHPWVFMVREDDWLLVVLWLSYLGCGLGATTHKTNTDLYKTPPTKERWWTDDLPEISEPHFQFHLCG